MSRFATSSTIETALSHTIVARLILEECELLIGSEYGAVLQPIQMNSRLFEPVLPPISADSEWTGCTEVTERVLTTLQTTRSLEICGGEGSALLQHLAQQSELLRYYPHGILYLHQADTIEDLLQTIFEQCYRVPSDVKLSREEIRVGLSDRQALVLLDQPVLTESEFDRLGRSLPESTFVVASMDRCFPQIEAAIELPQLGNEQDLRLQPDQDVLELLATVERSLSAEQISAIATISDLQRLTDLKLLQVYQGRYKLQRNYQGSDLWMEKVLTYVLEWLRSQPDAIVKEQELLMKTLQWSADHQRWAEVLEIAQSIERAFAIAKRWGNWDKILRFSLAAAWALEDTTIEAWALHQLGTLAFCQAEVTIGYDRLRDALELRTELAEQTAIEFTSHNLAQIKALIVPVRSKDRPDQRQFYWIVGLICAIALSISISVGILLVQQQPPNRKERSSVHRAATELRLTWFS